MRTGKAEICEYPIVHELGDETVIARDRARLGLAHRIVFADAWMWSPFVMLLVLAGLVSVPKYLYEAAAIDRVSGWRQFWSITFPYIRGLMLLALLFRTIESFLGASAVSAYRYCM